MKIITEKLWLWNGICVLSIPNCKRGQVHVTTSNFLPAAISTLGVYPVNNQIAGIQIDRPAKNAHITVHTARPGLVIGKKGEDIDALRKEVSARMGIPVHISVEEIRKPELDAQLVSESIAQQLERRIMFRRAMKRAVQNSMRIGAQGIKVNIAGRLNGAEIARSEWYREGRVPLHTLRADIDYGFAEAVTTYGIIGVKTWIFKGEVFGDRQEEQEAPASGKGAPRG